MYAWIPTVREVSAVGFVKVISVAPESTKLEAFKSSLVDEIDAAKNAAKKKQKI